MVLIQTYISSREYLSKEPRPGIVGVLKIPHIRPQLAGEDLSELDLSGVNLSEADLTEADLFDTDLSEANLKMASLAGADLSGAKLSDAELYKADLSKCYLTGANLSGAYLAEADFQRLRSAWHQLAGGRFDRCGSLCGRSQQIRSDRRGSDRCQYHPRQSQLCKSCFDQPDWFTQWKLPLHARTLISAFAGLTPAMAMPSSFVMPKTRIIWIRWSITLPRSHRRGKRKMMEFMFSFWRAYRLRP